MVASTSAPSTAASAPSKHKTHSGWKGGHQQKSDTSTLILSALVTTGEVLFHHPSSSTATLTVKLVHIDTSTSTVHNSISMLLYLASTTTSPYSITIIKSKKYKYCKE